MIAVVIFTLFALSLVIWLAVAVGALFGFGLALAGIVLWLIPVAWGALCLLAWPIFYLIDPKGTVAGYHKAREDWAKKNNRWDYHRGRPF